MKDVSALKQALPYIKRFKNNLFVIKFGGNVVSVPENLNSLTEDITILHQVGIRVIVVHGGGPQANELSRRLGHSPQVINGRRITGDQDLEIAKMIYGGKINIEIVSALRKNGSQGVGLSGIDGGLIKAKRRGITKMLDRETGKYQEVDFGHVGDVISIDTDLLLILVDSGYIPVISCLGADDEGNIYNINADVIAGKIASCMKADKLINITDVSGVLRDSADKESLISYLDIEQARLLIEEGIITKGMIPKVESCLSAIEGGVKRAHIIDGTRKDALLLEIFTVRGIGTMFFRGDRDRESYMSYELRVDSR